MDPFVSLFGHRWVPGDRFTRVVVCGSCVCVCDLLLFDVCVFSDCQLPPVSSTPR